MSLRGLVWGLFSPQFFTLGSVFLAVKTFAGVVGIFFIFGEGLSIFEVWEGFRGAGGFLSLTIFRGLACSFSGLDRGLLGLWSKGFLTCFFETDLLGDFLGSEGFWPGLGFEAGGAGKEKESRIFFSEGGAFSAFPGRGILTPKNNKK